MSLPKTHFPAVTKLVPLSFLANEVYTDPEWDFQEGPFVSPYGILIQWLVLQQLFGIMR